MVAKIQPVQWWMVDVVCDLRVDFLKLAPLRNFETSSHAVKKTIGSHLKLLILDSN